MNDKPNILVGQLPRHLYVWVDTAHTHKTPCGFVPAVWYGLVSYPGRAWGCTVMLESGSIYRDLPPHAIAFSAKPSGTWTVQDAQTWDCYGLGWSAVEYDYLHGLDCRAKCAGKEHAGKYLFSVAPVGDGFSAYPEQAKEFSFVQLASDRLTVQPTNHLLFVDRSFTRNVTGKFPTDLKRQTKMWSVE